MQLQTVLAGMGYDERVAGSDRFQSKTEPGLRNRMLMFTPYWSMTSADAVMNDFELHFDGVSDESSSIMHRFAKAFGVPYDISHNYWRNG